MSKHYVVRLGNVSNDSICHTCACCCALAVGVCVLSGQSVRLIAEVQSYTAWYLSSSCHFNTSHCSLTTRLSCTTVHHLTNIISFFPKPLQLKMILSLWHVWSSWVSLYSKLLLDSRLHWMHRVVFGLKTLRPCGMTRTIRHHCRTALTLH